MRQLTAVLVLLLTLSSSQRDRGIPVDLIVEKAVRELEQMSVGWDEIMYEPMPDELWSDTVFPEEVVPPSRK